MGIDAFTSLRPRNGVNRQTSKIYEDLRAAEIYRRTDAKRHFVISSHLIMDDSKQNKSLGNARGQPHVGIVGAGFSGLRCADILLQYGFRVTIIEGRDRIGGRVHQKALPNGRLADMGPNWIHGTNDNPMMDLAKETGTSLERSDAQTYVFDPSGKMLPVKEGERYATIMWDIIQDAFQYSNKNGRSISENMSLLDFFKDKVVEKIPDSEENHEIARKTILQLAEMWGAFIGSPISQQSLKFFWLEECIEGENLYCSGTYGKILEAISRPVLTQAEILLNTKAEKITYRSGTGDRVQVSLQGGQTLVFDEVVVTAPLGWLKRNTDAFSPRLPPRLTKAIGSLGYGCLEKVYISFPKAFWLPTDAEGDKVKGFVQWVSPDYASSTNPNKWNQEVVEMAGLSPEHSHPTLLFYMYGDQSRFLVNKLASLPNQEAKDEYMASFFHPYYSRLPNYSEADDGCKPLGGLATEWLNDELAGFGSYTNFPVGLQEGDEDVKTMRQGLPESGLWFAGEHTAPFVALGTSTGAYWSGEAVAKRITEMYMHRR